MRRIIRTITGIVILLWGAGLILFSFSLFTQKISWIIFGGILLFFSLGYGFIQLGYRIIRGDNLQKAVTFLLFIGRRTALMILIKQCNSIQLAHLYEHIFCARINALFYKHKLFPYLDFSLVGHTYHRGIIYIDVDFYTDKARALAETMYSLDGELNLDENTVLTAVTQIIAEKEVSFYSHGYDAIKDALEALRAQPWLDIDNVEILDTKNIRRTPGIFYVTKGKPIPARKLTIRLSLDPDFASSHRELLPFFSSWQYLQQAALKLISRKNMDTIVLA